MKRLTASAIGLALVATCGAAQAQPAERTYPAYITGYSFFDNTPPGSPVIAFPDLHAVADGIGTYEDPITLAVGHVIEGGISTPDFAPGTRFYLPYLQRYFIVEDLCGDGDRPQDGPCHTGGPAGEPWLDVWIDGRDGSLPATGACMAAITGTHTVIENPAPDYRVTAGPLFDRGCTTTFDETPLRN